MSPQREAEFFELGGPLLKGNVDIAKQARAIEWLKAEIVASNGKTLRAMVQGDEEQILNGLAEAIIAQYLLARRLGIHLARLDNHIQSMLRAHASNQHELERWFGDLTALASYLKKKEE